MRVILIAFMRTGKLIKTVTAGGLGSGFLVSENQVITAVHVVQVAEKEYSSR